VAEYDCAIIPACRRLRKEDWELEGSLGYRERLSLKFYFDWPVGNYLRIFGKSLKWPGFLFFLTFI
jgi:hypothetical protein